MLFALYFLIAIFVCLLLAAGVLGYGEWGKAKSGKLKAESDNPLQSGEIQITHPFIAKLYGHYSQTMIWQHDVFIWLMWCYLAGGHCLLTGLPGTGKTLAVKIFTQLMWLDMGRIQGTSDLLPADIVWSLIYNPKTSEFDTVFGPIMHECVLVDEINRMPSKTQSALLQAMAEWNIVVGQKTYDLPEHFMIIATQNPHDRVGTFPLPQAQLDRFMCQVVVQAPGIKEQGKILNQTKQKTKSASLLSEVSMSLDPKDDGVSDGLMIQDLAHEYNNITVSPLITNLIAQLIQDQWLSSRAGQQLIAFARAVALMQDKRIVEQWDIDVSLEYTMKHRLK